MDILRQIHDVLMKDEVDANEALLLLLQAKSTLLNMRDGEEE